MTTKRKNITNQKNITKKSRRNKNRNKESKSRKHAKKSFRYNKKNLRGGLIWYDSVGNRLETPRRVSNAQIKPFWLAYFNGNFTDMQNFKTKILQLSGQNDCSYLERKITAFSVTPEAMQYKFYICFITVFFSYLSELLEHTCELLVKGGRAVQLALSLKTRYDPLNKKQIASTTYNKKYESDDIDILILPYSKDVRDSQLLALRIGEFFDWLTTIQNPNGTVQSIFSFINVPRLKLPVETSPEVPGEGSIVKLSISVQRNGINAFVAVSDIGYITSEHTDIFEANPIRTEIYERPWSPGFLISVNPQNMLLEKTYYIMKYLSGTNATDYKLDRFRASLYKSYNFLLDDLAENIQNSFVASSNFTPKSQIKNDLITHYYTELIKVIPNAASYNITGANLITFATTPLRR